MSLITLELLVSGALVREEIFLPITSVVHSRIERFIYADDVDNGAVALDYLDGQKITPEGNLRLTKKAHSFGFNILGKQVNSITNTTLGNKIISEYSELLITDQAVVSPAGVNVPLWYKHKMPAGCKNIKISSITNTQKLLEDFFYKIDEDNGVIYVNKPNFVSRDGEEYLIHFATASNTNGNEYNSILNTSIAADIISWEDLEEGGSVTTRYPVYSKEYNMGSYSFNLNFSKQWYWKASGEQALEALVPETLSNDQAWYLTIRNRDTAGYINGATRRYWVPEYLTQPFVPAMPYMWSSNSDTILVNESTLLINRPQLYISTVEKMNAELWVYNHEGELIKIYTTDLALDGKRYSETDIFYDSQAIHSWDNHSGVVVLSKKVQPSWRIIAKHFYSNFNYKYTAIDLNPIINKVIQNHTVVVYCIPNTNADQRAVHHLLINESGVIVGCSQDHNSDINLSLYNSDNTVNTSSIIGKPYSSISDPLNFLDLYGAGKINSYGYLILAEIALVSKARVEKDNFIDVRAKGLRIVDEHLEDAYWSSPTIGISSAYGHADGAVLPENRIMIVDIPVSLLEDYGGIFKSDEIIQHLRSNLDAGTALIPNWTYTKPEISAVSEVVGEVVVTCSWEGPNYNYKLHRRTSPINEWAVAANTIDPPEGSIVFSLVENSGEVIYYCVSVSINGIDFPMGDSIAVKVR